jgi:3'-phosphoadenosine 5'-phosphosulfate sulfotransferase (PAPS reductase)/FAD synthetase
MFSGGVGSWAAAKRVAERHGTEHLTLLFTDTLIEDADLYRFLDEAAANVGGTLVKLADGRTPWEVFRDTRMLGNARIARCSHDLKQKVAARWLAEHAAPGDMIHVGIDWTEGHRLDAVRRNYGAQGFRVSAPLCEAPFITKPDALAWLEREGIQAPRLYRLGFAHNNCGGGCVRAGVGHFAHLYRALPEVFAEWERNEESLREFLGRDDVAILRDRSGGMTKPLPLTQLRRRLDEGYQPDLFDIGGCGCFIDPPLTEAA